MKKRPVGRPPRPGKPFGIGTIKLTTKQQLVMDMLIKQTGSAAEAIRWLLDKELCHSPSGKNHLT